MSKQKYIRVAIADDHIMMRKGAVSLLNSFEGVEVVLEADNGDMLIKQLKETKKIPDICILDISMPVLNGFETILELKYNWPEMKCLVLSMHNNEFSILRMIKSGANGYLLKASPPEELYAALLSIYKKGYYDSELVSSSIFQVVEAKFKNKELLPKITDKELEFLAFCCSELNYKEIAAKMKLSVRTVEGYRDNLFDKLQVNTRIGLVMFAINTGLLSLELANDIMTAAANRH